MAARRYTHGKDHDVETYLLCLARSWLWENAAGHASHRYLRFEPVDVPPLLERLSASWRLDVRRYSVLGPLPWGVLLSRKDTSSLGLRWDSFDKCWRLSLILGKTLREGWALNERKGVWRSILHSYKCWVKFKRLSFSGRQIGFLGAPMTISMWERYRFHGRQMRLEADTEVGFAIISICKYCRIRMGLSSDPLFFFYIPRHEIV